MEERGTAKLHKVIMNNRKSGNFTGIKDVISFDPKEILLETEMGMLQIKGEDLHVSRLTLEKGEVDIQGMVISMVYSEIESYGKKAENFLGRLFR
ncbi:MAG: sporulation protein YabP [Lachnospiraceae bacterium]|nr:sporulation protein YabP [Lachnospiraceae bacterium]